MMKSVLAMSAVIAVASVAAWGATVTGSGKKATETRKLPVFDAIELKVSVDVSVGSVFFLASGYLAFAETCHAYFAWKPARISWWVTFVNLFGCVAFMISAVFAFIPPESPRFDALTISVIFTFVGAVGFLIGSLLMLPETATPAES